MMRTIASLALFCGLAAAVPASPPAHQVVRVMPQTDAELAALMDLGLDLDGLDWWTTPSIVGHPVDVHVTPGSEAERAFRKTSYANSTVMVSDLDAQIKAQQADQAAARVRLPLKETLDPRGVPEFYLDYNEIIDYMFIKAAEYPEICTVEQIGESLEGRGIFILKVHGANASPPNKPELYMEAVLHAREWITSGALNWILAEVLEKYGTDARITAAVDAMDFTFNLVANPDGYQHSHTPLGRLWRKNRSPSPDPNRPQCIGTDPNRNWPAGWGGGGASTDPCSDAFRGTGPASTPCVRDILRYLTTRQENIRQGAFYDHHSFGDFLISPSGFTATPAPDYPVMEAAMQAMVVDITAVHGTPYDYGSIASWFGVASGGSIDTTYTDLGIVHSYASELRGSAFGFIVPFSEVTETAEETLAGVMALVEFILQGKKAQQ